MFKAEAGNARSSRAIAKFSNDGVGHFELKLIVHVLIRGSLTIKNIFMKTLLNNVVQIAIDAGKEILDVYENEFDVDIKSDGSPLTIADRRAHDYIERALGKLNMDAPILSEESTRDAFENRHQWHEFWLVDPLDGTKEFVKRNGEFTVNIALIRNGAPVLGVVHTPVKNFSHFAAQGIGAFKQEDGKAAVEISVKKYDKDQVIMVASRSHSGIEVEQYRTNMESAGNSVEIASMGSSLKICLVAEGAADIYPRLGPTSEWDTAAAHCVLEVAGGKLTDLTGRSLIYNKSDILNPWFLASADPEVDWTEFLQ